MSNPYPPTCILTGIEGEDADDCTTHDHETEQFDPDRTRFTRQMADGHQMRLGHRLEGYYQPTGDDGIVRLVRTCCDAS